MSDTTTEIVKAAPTADTSPIIRMAAKYGTTPAMLNAAIESVCFKPDRDGNVPPPELKLAFYLVCEANDLNPLKREVFALYDAGKNALMPYVSIDGWLRKANENPAFDGMTVSIDGYEIDNAGRKWPTGATCAIYRKDRAHPIVWNESFAENFRENKYKSGPWYDRPERMIKWKATIQAIRVAFHIAGIMDEQEATEALHGVPAPLPERDQQAANLRKMIDDATAAKAAKPAEPVEVAAQTAPAEAWTPLSIANYERVEKKGKFARWRVVDGEGAEYHSEQPEHEAVLDMALAGRTVEAVLEHRDGKPALILKIAEAQ